MTLGTELARSDMSEAISRELLITKMLKHLGHCLITVKNVSFEELAVTADQMITSSAKMHIEQSLFTIRFRVLRNVIKFIGRSIHLKVS